VVGSPPSDRESFKKRTNLYWAAKNGRDMIVSLLLEKDKEMIGLETISRPMPLLAPSRSLVTSSLGDQASEISDRPQAMQDHQTQFLSLKEKNKYRLNAAPQESVTEISTADVAAAAILAAENGHKNVWEMLLHDKRGVVNWKDSNGQTLLSYAAEYGQKDLVEVLLNLTEDKIDVNSSDNKGRTPLSYAVEDKYGADVLQLLIFHQADINLADNEGRSPLSYAAGQGNEQNVKLLLQNSAIQDTIDKAGQTPVLRAIEGRKEMKRDRYWRRYDDTKFISVLSLLGSPVDSSP
jgi:ankyrin repeat protein